MATSPATSPQYQRSSGGGAPTRSKSLGRAADHHHNTGKNGSNSNNSKSKQNRGGTTSPPYRDVIDKLDLSGLLGGGFHHSGPFDAASSISRANAPIAAFSQSALDPTYSGTSPNAAPLRESAHPRQARVGNGSGNGISARAKATLAAMEGTDAAHHYNDPNNSSAENLLAGMPNLQRRDSDNNSITLGYPSNETHAKERKILEAFGVHSEAYLDYGNSSYARKPPRASVAPSPNSSITSFSSSNSPTARTQTGVGKLTRADRTASIWDIEATLREGRPVGAAPPPMPVIPDRFLQAPAPTSPPNGSEGGVKRSKSLLARMRNKKGAIISSPTSKEAPNDSSYFASSAGPAPLPYERSNSGQSLSGSGGEKEGYSFLNDDHHSPSANEYSDKYNNDSSRPGMGGRRSTSPVEQKIARNYLKPTMSSPTASRYEDDNRDYHLSQSGSRSHSSSARRSPQPPSPLGLPEGPNDIFGSGDSSGMMKPSMSRSHRNGDLANESALAAILAESSSKESGMTHSTSSSSNNSGYGGRGDSSGYGYAQTDSSYASDKTSTPERSRMETSLGNSTGSSSTNNTPSPADGKLSRKTSLASRLLRGRAKRNS
ncbi:hypothetical protein P389DRAFT_164976 [Cystobasidium minutum MCA 4210]|uniref:uncharacterized protein n=1 Tax=Cystobasidium minutum MCA 4210 TaxID=1397322 RepID=UPI0034CE8532|eukprot:jgi/Rhomi1/164976/fgenesh1_kg.1_\